MKKIIVDDKNEIFVMGKYCGIDPFVLHLDNIPHFTFGKSLHLYYTLNSIIEWFEQEIKTYPHKDGRLSRPLKKLESLRSSIEKKIQDESVKIGDSQ